MGRSKGVCKHTASSFLSPASSPPQVRLGRKSIKCEQIIFCLSPPELKGLLRKVIFEGKQMDALVKEDTLVKKYLSKFRSHAVRISNVCFAKNVLPLSHSLVSWMSTHGGEGEI